MQPSTKKPSTIPPTIQSALNQQLPPEQASKQISSQPQKIFDWFLKKIINFASKQVPRITLLKYGYDLMEKNVPDKKYLNNIFLNDDSLLSIIQASSDFVDLAFVLMHNIELQTKVKEINYGEIVMNRLRLKFDELLQKNQKNLPKLLRITFTESFLDHKLFNRESVYDMGDFQLETLREEIFLMHKYVFSPIFSSKTPTDFYHLLYPIVMWMIVFPESNDEQQLALLDLSKKISIYLCGKKNSSNLHFIRVFNITLDLLSVKYLHDDPFRFETLAPLLLSFQQAMIPFREMMNNWFHTRQNKEKLGLDLQYVFRNTLNSGAIILAFHLIDHTSKLLHEMRDYNTLFHLFSNFIRKDYIVINLPNKTFLGKFMEILFFYVIGFINRDRLDGETQLDRLTHNLRMLIFSQNFTYKEQYHRIIMFYKIYENRFFCLSHSSKKFIQNLQSFYGLKVDVTDIHSEVSRHMFKQFSADYDQNDLFSLKRSERYLGMANLGNTCYINSYMQALYMTKKFKALVIETRDEGSLPRGMNYFSTLIQLFTQLSTKKINSLEPEVDPLFFKEKVPQPFKSSWDQHDSGQFGRLYLDSLVTEVKSLSLGDKIDKMFNHKINQKIICKKCNKSRENTEAVFDFLLNFNQKETNQLSVSELLRNFFKGNDLGPENKINCTFCSTQTEVHVKAQPLQFSEYLVATINIFRYEGIQGRKLIKPLNFEFILNLKNILPNNDDADIQYQLYAFIVHMGTQSDRGHYVCYARNLQENPMIWYNFNDHYVTEREIKKIEDFKFGQNETPYILFYSSTAKKHSIMRSTLKK